MKMDARVRNKIVELVGVGVRKLPEMKRHLRHFVCDVLFSGETAPALTDARFWPSSHNVLNCMYTASLKLRCCTVCLVFTVFYCIHCIETDCMFLRNNILLLVVLY